MTFKYLFASTKQQRIDLYVSHQLVRSYPVSTGKNGTGQQQDSEKTPLGWHMIAEKHGHNAPLNAVLVAREETGEIYTPELHTDNPDRDWILTRILRLKGLKEGFNAGGSVDTFKRYIYLHGTPDTTKLGVIGSRGCIRMQNEAIITLFNEVEIGTPVYISDN